MKIVLIEDEKITANDLANTIREVEPSAEIVAILHSVEEGVEFFNQAEAPAIDLLFSDIQLGDGLSFELFKIIDNVVPIIFCTAYNEYTLDAFDSAGIGYILKPFTADTVRKGLDKYKSLTTTQSTSADLAPLFEQIQQQLGVDRHESIIVQKGDKIIPISSEEIMLFCIENENVYAYTFDQKKHFVNQKMDVLEQKFAPHFFRANRQYIVNRKGVKDASHSFNRKVQVNLRLPFPEKIIVSKMKASSFINWLATY